MLLLLPLPPPAVQADAPEAHRVPGTVTTAYYLVSHLILTLYTCCVTLGKFLNHSWVFFIFKMGHCKERM